MRLFEFDGPHDRGDGYMPDANGNRVYGPLYEMTICAREGEKFLSAKEFNQIAAEVVCPWLHSEEIKYTYDTAIGSFLIYLQAPAHRMKLRFG